MRWKLWLSVAVLLLTVAGYQIVSSQILVPGGGGATGQQGATGATGPTGATGATGPTGPAASGVTQDFVLCTGVACATTCTLQFTSGSLSGSTGTCP